MRVIGVRTWWDEGDCPIIFKSREPDTLVEFYVLHLDRLSTGRPSCALEHDLVVQAQSQFGHARKVTFHFDGAQDLRTNDIPICVDEEIDGLYDIEEDLILPVPYPI